MPRFARTIDVSTGEEVLVPFSPEEEAAADAAHAAENAPVDLNALDTAELNRALTQPGTVTRAMGEILFGVIKGTIPVTPSLTKAAFVSMLKARMR